MTGTKEEFKVCTKCKTAWKSREAFIADAELSILGYQASLQQPNAGLFVFQHDAKDCHTSLSVKVAKFADLYQGPVYQDNMFRTGSCEGHCLKPEDFEVCSNQCSNAYVREILLILIKRFAKNRTARS